MPTGKERSAVEDSRLTGRDYPFLANLEDDTDLQQVFDSYRAAFASGNLQFDIRTSRTDTVEEYGVFLTMTRVVSEDQVQVGDVHFCSVRTNPRRVGMTDADLRQLNLLVTPLSDDPDTVSGLAKEIMDRAEVYRVQGGRGVMVPPERGLGVAGPTEIDRAISGALSTMVHALANTAILTDERTQEMILELAREKMERALGDQQHRNNLEHLRHAGELSDKAMVLINKVVGIRIDWLELYKNKFGVRGADFHPTVEDLARFFVEVWTPVVETVLPLSREVGQKAEEQMAIEMARRTQEAKVRHAENLNSLAIARLGHEAAQRVEVVVGDARVASEYAAHGEEFEQSVEAGAKVAGQYGQIPGQLGAGIAKGIVQIPIKAVEGVKDGFEKSKFSDGEKVFYGAGIIVSMVGIATANPVLVVGGLFGPVVIKVGGESLFRAVGKAIKGVKESWANRGKKPSGFRGGGNLTGGAPSQ